MHLDVLEQYKGYSRTPNLWLGDTIYGLSQFEYELSNPLPIAAHSLLPQRLGKRIEHFVSHDIKQLPNTEIITENLQIKRDKQTIGEIDAIITQNSQPIHLEIIYKFYLYDESVGTSQLDHWIGPNRNDSLVFKLNKLKQKQLPLLYHEQTKKQLDYLSIQNIEQSVLFKAQLFVPKPFNIATLESINTNCIAGYYYTIKQLPSFSDCQFYIPNKLNWLITINQRVTWLNFTEFEVQLTVLLQKKRSPLVWIKHPDGILERAFIVWW